MREERHGNVLVYFPEKEIDLNNSGTMKTALERAIERNEKKLLVDLSAVSYIDSSGLTMLIEALHHVQRIDGRLRLCGMNSKIRNLLEITNLLGLFENFDTLESALRDF
jgi:anti-sigma B factor antagonist